MSKKEIQIPEEIREIMSYLSHNFARSMKDPVNSKEDLFQDLVVLYLEQDTKKVKDLSSKDQWYVYFRSTLLNKYKHLQVERQALDTLAKELRI